MAWDKIFAGRGVSAPQKEITSEESDSVPSPAESSIPDARREARRSKRVYIAMPVIVKGQQGKDAFEERASTESVNAHGGMIRLAKSVDRGQKLILTNLKSEEVVECRVVFVGQTEAGKTQAGVEFTRPAGYFWHIAFPPDDWRPADRKRPTAEAGLAGRRS
ncbi:MAG: hypothetical protein ACYDDI_17015 [Candidatus Acidiferrales bacterium]